MNHLWIAGVVIFIIFAGLWFATCLYIHWALNSILTQIDACLRKAGYDDAKSSG
jgi:hypothetical protein